MDKSQAIDWFWNGFGLPAYDENTVPQDAPMPRITYSVATDSFENVVNMDASIWYKGRSWKDASLKAEEVARRLGERGGEVIPLDRGLLWIVKGKPFAQRLSDPDGMMRRIRLNVQAEYLTPY